MAIVTFTEKNRIVLEPQVKDASRWWSREDLLLIVLIAALFYLPGLGQICLFDRDEPRFSEAAREMLHSGDYIVPRFNGDLRPDKPPLLYWVMSLSYRLVGDNELGARLPSAFFSMLTLIAVYFIAGFRFGRITGIVAALMLGSCSIFIVESRLATADATMIFFTTVALGCAWRSWDVGSSGHAPGSAMRIIPRAQYLVHRQGSPILDQPTSSHAQGPVSWWVRRLFWVALAGGTLTKGVPLLFVFLPMIVLSIATGSLTQRWRHWKTQSIAERVYHLPSLIVGSVIRGNWSWWRNLNPASGFVMLIGLVGWWVVAAGVETNWEIFRQMIGHHVVARMSEGLESHKQWPGFYISIIWGTFMPWSILLIPMAYFTFRRLLGRTPIAIDPKPYQFLVVWVVPSWIFYECLGTKLPHYTLPLFVALVILCADMLVQSWNRLTDVLDAKWFRWMGWGWLAFWTLIAGVGLAYLWFTMPNYFRIGLPMGAALVALGVGGAIAWNRPTWVFITILGYATALLLGNIMLMPAIRELRISQDCADVLHKYHDQGYAIAACGYEEPSLVFYVGQWMHKPPEELHTLNFINLKQVNFWIEQATHHEPDSKMCIVINEPEFQALGAKAAALEIARYPGFPGIRFKSDPAKPVVPHIVHIIVTELPATLPATAPTSTTAPAITTKP